MKKIGYEDIQVDVMWICPYVKCGHENYEGEREPMNGEFLVCNKCKKPVKYQDD